MNETNIETTVTEEIVKDNKLINILTSSTTKKVGIGLGTSAAIAIIGLVLHKKGVKLPKIRRKNKKNVEECDLTQDMGADKVNLFDEK